MRKRLILWLGGVMATLVPVVVIAVGNPPGSAGNPQSTPGGSTTFHLNDDTNLQYGNTAAAPDFWCEHDTAATPDEWACTSTDIDGVGTNGIVLRVADGTATFTVNNESTLTEGASITGDHDTACAGPSIRPDFDGLTSCPYTTDVAPAGIMIHPPDNYGAGTQTPGNLVLRGGIDEKSVAIDAAANCTAGDTITATIGLSSAATTTCVCTYGTDWCSGACATDDATALSLAACLTACVGFDSSSTTDPVTLQIDPTEGKVASVILTESDATCSTVSNGTEGTVFVPAQMTITLPSGNLFAAPAMTFNGDTDTGVYQGTVVNTVTIGTGGNGRAIFNSSGVTIPNGSGGVVLGTNMGSLTSQTAQTPDSGVLSVGSLSNGMIVCETGDVAYDFAHAQQTNPTIWIQSAAQSATQWGSLAHNGTNFVVDTGAGVVSVPDGVTTAANLTTTGSGIVVSAGAIRDVGTTCTAGEVMIDIGGVTVEICVCTATDTIRCAATTTTNPVD